MEYTTDIAEKIAKKLNVPTATLLTWKNRKKIPNKYFNPDGSIIDQLPDNISDADKYRIKNVYELDMFNFSQFKSVTVQQIADIDRGKGTLTKKEYIAFKAEIADLKNKYNAACAIKPFDSRSKKLKEFLNEPRIKPYVFQSNENRLIENFIRHDNIEVDELEGLIVEIGIVFQSCNL